MCKVSIITPLYNKGPYIEETIRSVQAQTFTNWEMIVVDNGSTDDGPERILRLAADEHRVRLVESPKRGPGAARNFGLARATGEWILFLDADDLIEPDYLQTQLAVAARHPEAALIVGGWQEFPATTPARREIKMPSGRGQTVQALLDSTVAFAPWAVHAAIIRRDVLSPDYQWPEELDRLLNEDATFWFRLIHHAPVAYSESIGALYRTQTIDCRSQYQDISKWFAGTHATAMANFEWLQQRGQPPTEDQMENLFRLYAGLYGRALQLGEADTTAQALGNARQWLVLRLHSGQRAPWALCVARVLGVRNYLRLHRWSLRPRQSWSNWLRQHTLTL